MSSTAIAAIIVAGITFFATLYIVARKLSALYGGSTANAFSHLLNLVLGRTAGFVVVDEGRVVLPAGTGPVFGPRLVIVRPRNAVTMVNGGQVTRVKGAGIFSSDRFEFVAHVHDLRDQQRSYTFPDVLSRDALEITAHLTVTFAPDISEGARRGSSGLADPDADLFRRLPFSMPHWEQATRSAVEQSLRRVVNCLSLDDLLARTHLLPLERRVIELSSRRTQEWGIRVSNVIIESLAPRPEITSAASDSWVTDSNIAVEVAKSEAFSQALLRLANAYGNAISLGMPPDAITHEVLRRTLEQLGRDPATKVVITPQWPGAHDEPRSNGRDDGT